MKIYKKILLVLAFVAVAMTAGAQKSNFVSHTVVKGQTLYSISKMYNTTVEEIIKFNPGSAEKISIGQKLIVPRNTANKYKNSKTHTIQPGETLYRLSKIYNVTTDEICAANPGLTKNNFRAGEVIIIPTREQEAEQEAEHGIKAAEPETTVAQQKQEDNKTQIIICTHTVGRKENIESICEEYGITKEELIKANPVLVKKKKIKRKMVLNIPVSSAKLVNASAGYNSATAQETATEPKIEEVFVATKGFKDDNVLNVAVVLSFLLDSYAPREQSRMVEYYQGFLMAVEKLKHDGFSFIIDTYDAGHKDESLDSLIASGALNNAELIIGASYSKHTKELAEFARRREIPLVIPFSSKKEEAMNNPMVYMANGIQQFILPQVSKNFVKTFPNASVIFVEDTVKGNKMEFVNSLTAELKRNSIPYTRLPMETVTATDSLIPILHSINMQEKEPVIIPTSSSASTLNTLLPALLQAKGIDSTATAKSKIFGYPEWQIHAKDTRSLMYETDTYFYATFYSHYALPRVAEFQEEFFRWYDRPIQNIYPRYGMLGYDTGYFFLLAASLHGNQLAEKINETPFVPIQSDFKFEQIGSRDGFVNNKFHFIHYRPDFWIEKLDFDQEENQEESPQKNQGSF